MHKRTDKASRRRNLVGHGLSLALSCGLLLGLSGGVARADTGLGFSSQFASAGTGAGQLTSPTGVAIDQSSGDVYVVDSANARVEKFGPSGEFILTFGWEVNETTKGNICSEAEITGSGDTCKAAASGSEPGQFGLVEFFGVRGPIGIAVDPTAPHDVYVTDTINNRVQEFDASGNYVGQVNGSEPSCPGTFSSPSGVAVDPSSGELYVADAGNNRIVKINPLTGACDEVFDNEVANTTNLTSMSAIALDTAGNIYVAGTDAETGGGVVDKFSPAGALQSKVALQEGDSPVSVGVNPASNDVYVGDSSGAGYHFLQYGPTGTLLDEFGDTFYPSGLMPFVQSSTGVAVDQGSGDVYASDHSKDVVVLFNPTTTLPSISGVSAPSPSATTATLQGTIAPGDASNSYHFDYGLDTRYTSGSTVEATPSTGAAEAELTGLQPNKTYHYRLVVSNADGTSYGADQTLTTLGQAPAAEGESTSSITQTEATLEAQVNPNNEATHWYFEYGTSPSLEGALSAPASPGTEIPPGFANVTVSQGLTNLQPNTTYYYRVVADNGTGQAKEVPIASFTTTPPPPTAITEDASEITQTTATVTGNANGQGAETHYFFNYGESTAYGNVAPAEAPPGVEAGKISEDTPESLQLTGLTPNRTYHYRLVVYNVPCSHGFFPGTVICSSPTNITDGGDQTFTTLALPPTVQADQPANISPSGATLTGSLNPQGVAGSYHFEYGTTTAYGTSLPEAAVAATDSGLGVSANIAGLDPNTIYHYRLVAANNGGSTVAESPDETFSTYAAGGSSTAPLPPGFSVTGTAPPAPVAAAFPDLAALAPTPSATAPPPPKPPLTTAQKLAKALKACKVDKSKSRRATCEKQARKKYHTTTKRAGKKK